MKAGAETSSFDALLRTLASLSFIWPAVGIHPFKTKPAISPNYPKHFDMGTLETPTPLIPFQSAGTPVKPPTRIPEGRRKTIRTLFAATPLNTTCGNCWTAAPLPSRMGAEYRDNLRSSSTVVMHCPVLPFQSFTDASRRSLILARY